MRSIPERRPEQPRARRERSLAAASNPALPEGAATRSVTGRVRGVPTTDGRSGQRWLLCWQSARRRSRLGQSAREDDGDAAGEDEDGGDGEREVEGVAGEPAAEEAAERAGERGERGVDAEDAAAGVGGCGFGDDCGSGDRDDGPRDADDGEQGEAAVEGAESGTEAENEQVLEGAESAQVDLTGERERPNQQTELAVEADTRTAQGRESTAEAPVNQGGLLADERDDPSMGAESSTESTDQQQFRDPDQGTLSDL